MGVELMELPDWNCCGGLSAASLLQGGVQTFGSRNLEQLADDTTGLLCPCPHCLTSFGRALEESRQEGPSAGEIQLLSILDVFADEEILTTLIEKRLEPLTGLRMAAYYGCKLSRAEPELTAARAARAAEDGARPLERIIEACGATAVEWTAGEECCGAALGVARMDVADELLAGVFSAAREAEAEALVTVCPLCQLNLDLRQHQISQKLHYKVDLPVFFVTELMAVALGMDRESERWLERHVTSAFPLFMEFIEAQEEREYWGEEASPEGDEQDPGEQATSTEEARAGVPVDASDEVVGRETSEEEGS
jgi:heterodisulfide reductase subunit B